MHRFNSTVRFVSCAAILTLSPLVAAPAQTNDEARLTLGISGGYIGSQFLWQVDNQPVASPFIEPDLFRLRREMKSDITISGHATYFPSPHLGFVGDFTFLGLGTSDGCSVQHDNGSVELQAVCDAISGTIGTASTTAVNGGLVFRPFSRSFLQPYFKGLVGLAFTPSSTIALRSVYGSIGDTALINTIYIDPDWKPIRPTWTLGFGISTAPASGYQIHVEARETWLSLGAVTGPTTGQGLYPDHKSVLKMFPSILVGFDVVLAKQRGRRY